VGYDVSRSEPDWYERCHFDASALSFRPIELPPSYEFVTRTIISPVSFSIPIGTAAVMTARLRHDSNGYGGDSCGRRQPNVEDLQNEEHRKHLWACHETLLGRRHRHSGHHRCVFPFHLWADHSASVAISQLHFCDVGKSMRAPALEVGRAHVCLPLRSPLMLGFVFA
jgi:hypothetical protein